MREMLLGPRTECRTLNPTNRVGKAPTASQSQEAPSYPQTEADTPPAPSHSLPTWWISCQPFSSVVPS